MGGGRSKWVSDSQAERETLPLNVPCLKEGSVRNPQISGEFGGLKLHNFFFSLASFVQARRGISAN